jgi:hypothetical protein
LSRLAKAVETVEDQVEAELEFGLVVAPAKGRIGVVVDGVCQHASQMRELPAMPSSAAESSADGGPPDGVNISWVKPSALLPRACKTWWTTS